MIEANKNEVKSNVEKIIIIKNGEEKEVEIDEEVNEVRKRRIKGLMQKDQCIDLFMEAEIDVGKTKKRLYENIPHK